MYAARYATSSPSGSAHCQADGGIASAGRSGGVGLEDDWNNGPSTTWDAQSSMASETPRLGEENPKASWKLKVESQVRQVRQVGMTSCAVAPEAPRELGEPTGASIGASFDACAGSGSGACSGAGFGMASTTLAVPASTGCASEPQASVVSHSSVSADPSMSATSAVECTHLVHEWAAPSESELVHVASAPTGIAGQGGFAGTEPAVAQCMCPMPWRLQCTKGAACRAHAKGMCPHCHCFDRSTPSAGESHAGAIGVIPAERLGGQTYYGGAANTADRVLQLLKGAGGKVGSSALPTMYRERYQRLLHVDIGRATGTQPGAVKVGVYMSTLPFVMTSKGKQGNELYYKYAAPGWARDHAGKWVSYFLICPAARPHSHIVQYIGAPCGLCVLQGCPTPACCQALPVCT